MIRKLASVSTLAVAGLVTVGLLSLQGGAVTASDDVAKRDEDTPDIVLVADDDDDDTNDNSRNTGDSRSRADNTNSRKTAVSRDRDRSRGDLTRDWTGDGKGDKKKRDWSANKTNDRSRNDTRPRR